MMVQQKRVAIVTGANRGIGKGIARQLAAFGLIVALTGRRLENAQAAAADLSSQGDVRPYQLDVTDPASVDRLAADIDRDFGRLDVLVNNAGGHWNEGERASSLDLGAVEAALQTNLIGAWRMAIATIPLMLRNRYGRIVNVSSRSGSFQRPGASVPAYRVSKAALNMFTCTLAADLLGRGILVNAACPGWVRTEMGSQSAPRSVEEGADTPVWLATLPDDGPTGGFFADRQPIPW
jgi:NAD(P)-dependent dehydrogenase (short-subunit alcohol dehydrogenase family)